MRRTMALAALLTLGGAVCAPTEEEKAAPKEETAAERIRFSVPMS